MVYLLRKRTIHTTPPTAIRIPDARPEPNAKVILTPVTVLIAMDIKKAVRPMNTGATYVVKMFTALVPSSGQIQ